MTAITGTIQHLRSPRAGARPGDGTVRWLLDGETFINQADGVLCTLAANGSMHTFGTQAATGTAIGAAIAPLAPLASPVLTGTPTAPTPAVTVSDKTVATMASIRNVLTYLSPEMCGAVGDGVTDDSTAVAQAYLAAGAANRTVFFSKPSYLLATTSQIVIPDGVGTCSHATFVGADNGTNLPQLNFANGGGFYAGNGAGFDGMRLSGSGSATLPLIEAKGQIGVYNCRTEGAPYGIQASRRVVLGYSNCPSINAQIAPASGLTNGTYSQVAFTGTGNSPSGTVAVTMSGATVKVTVSGGAVTAIVFDTAGTCSLPNFMLGFAAGALYSGSPAITNAAQAFLSPMGRSRFHELWMIGHKQTSLEIDGALDFSHMNNVHVWDPTGISSTSTGFRLGHVDGLGMVGCKIFAMNSGIVWSKPSNGNNSFASVIGLEMDYTNVGHVVAGPMKLDMTGGYQQCIGQCLRVAHPSAIVKTNANLLSQADHHVTASDFAEINISGVNFERGAANAGLYNVYLTTTTGKGVFTVAGNTSDGNSPFAYIAGAVSGTIGPNQWPGKNYAVTDGNGNVTPGYAVTSGVTGSGVFVSAVRGGMFGANTDANGRILIPHQYGAPGPSLPRVQMVGAAANAGWRAEIIGIDATNITAQCFNAAGTPLGQNAYATVIWNA